MSRRAVEGVAPALARREAALVSPLRYPGGKRRFVGYVAEALRLNDLRPRLYVEPFAGGASVALDLMATGQVERVLLGERDPLVAAFWRVVFSDPDWLCERVLACQPSLAEWTRLREAPGHTDREKAWACLYLNRTSFSGILSGTAGPIGGQAQTSGYGIGCRFPANTLIRRLRAVARFANRVRVVEGDYRATLAAARSVGVPAAERFVYLDPPFYRKAARLYRHHFGAADHRALRATVTSLRAPYLLSYDAAPEVRALYTRAGVHGVELLYSASGRGDLVRATEIVVSNLPKLPASTRLWRTSAEWRGDVRDGAGA
jgi:DNA adenine methylase